MGRGLILMRQLASRGRLSSHGEKGAYSVLAAVSNCYSQHQGRSSTRYSPVRHSTRDRSPFRVRLACVKHAASVQSEPESNSPVQNCQIPAAQKSEYQSQRDFLPLAIHFSMNDRAFAPRRFPRRESRLCAFSFPLSIAFCAFLEISFRRTVSEASEAKQRPRL